MALSTAQEQYVNAILPRLLSEYPNGYYLIYNEFDSDTNYDLVIISSDERIFITQKGYTENSSNYIFNFDDKDYVRYLINTSNPSGYNPDLSDRIVVGLLPSEVLYVPRSVTIFTNADQPYDSVAGIPVFGDYASGKEWHYGQKNEIFSIGLGVLVCLLVLLNFFRWVFGKHSS